MLRGDMGEQSTRGRRVYAPSKEDGGRSARLDFDDYRGAVMPKTISCDRGRQMDNVADDAKATTAPAARATGRCPPWRHGVDMHLRIGRPIRVMARFPAIKRSLAKGGGHAASPQANSAISAARAPTIPTLSTRS